MSPGMAREDVTFDSWGDRCAAWLYRPEGDGDAPCVVIAHGWAGIREARLDAFAERFADAGFAAVVFDYRHFGASEGEPRQLLDIGRQLADWAAAIAYVRTLEGIEHERIALWGSSFGGGHVIETAARDRRIAAVVAQVPYVDGLRNLPRLGAAHALKLSREGLIDQIGALRGRAPHMLKAVGPPGSTAVMTSADADPGYHGLIPSGVDWIDETAARVMLRVTSYRPIRAAARVRCPIMFAIAQDDAVTPPDLAQEAAAKAPRAEVKLYPGGHFDTYVEPLFDRVVADETEFLARHLLGAGSASGERAPANAAS